ncbi:hypothetical protein BC941DRAFT_454676 [Chlamydoabsidia padenii]|nr:hypothetical protein BC941DRAFT_454676 [Chlamydoabsidia padenii]
MAEGPTNSHFMIRTFFNKLCHTIRIYTITKRSILLKEASLENYTGFLRLDSDGNIRLVIENWLAYGLLVRYTIPLDVLLLWWNTRSAFLLNHPLGLSFVSLVAQPTIVLMYYHRWTYNGNNKAFINSIFTHSTRGDLVHG